MAQSSFIGAAPAVADAAIDHRRYRPALALLASLFFIWGFITVINNTLLPHLRAVFDLSYTQTTLLESAWFIAYFFASLPSAWLIERVGYQRAMVTGLLIMALGAPHHDSGRRGYRPMPSSSPRCSSSRAASRCCRSPPILTLPWSGLRRRRRRD